MELEVHLLDSSHALATLGPVVIRVIDSASTEMADLDRIRERVDAVLERSPAAGAWIVVHHGAPVPDIQVRRYAGRVLRPLGDRLIIAYAMLGLGFWASAATAATVTLAKLIGMRSPIETTLERSAEKLCMDLIGVDPKRLVAAHDHLFERMRLATVP